jgi:metallopeptidase MepB
MESVIAKFQSMHNTMVQTVTQSTACFANTFEPWGRVANETESDTGMIQLLSYAAADKDTKDAAYEAQELLNSAEAAWMSRTDLFILLKAAADKNEKLDSECKHWVEAKMRDFTMSGHGSLDELTMHTYIRQRSKIDQLKERYNRNLVEENGGLWMGQEELDGVPEDELQKWKQDEGINEGKYSIPFANGGSKIVLSHSCREITRKKMFLAEEARVPENMDLLQEIACLRDSQARLLGYESHGAFRIKGRAIKSVKYVEQLLMHLKESLVPPGRQELEHLQKLRLETLKKHGIFQYSDNDQFPPWDLTYYKRLASLTARVDEETISEFFPLGPTVTSMLRIFESVLMLRFVQIPSDQLDCNSRWHESVQVWESWDNRNNEFIGFLYLDLLWRKHKYRGSQNVNIHCVRLTEADS